MSVCAITGASGLVGGNLAEALLRDGHRVVATKRASTKIDHLAHLKIEWRDADLSDVEALTKAFDGADVVFHCAVAVQISPRVTPAAKDIDAVVVQPTYMLGPYDVRPSSGQMVLEIASGRLRVATPGYQNCVDVRDVARGMILAWHKGKRGEKYILRRLRRPARPRHAALAKHGPPRLSPGPPVLERQGQT